jgi:hypothetical protein
MAATLVVGGCSSEEVVRGKNNLPVRCLNEPQPGPCGTRSLGYFYDYRYDRCRPFHYGGCQAHVPFETLDACQRTCVESGR